MTIKEIKESIENNNVYFGIKEALKHKKKVKSVFVTKDVRESTLKILQENNIEYSILKPKAEVIKQLNLDFHCEVFSIKK